MRALALTICLLPGLADAQPWTGTFALEGRGCAATGDARPITIHADGIEFYESACTFVSVVNGGWGEAYLAAMTCSGEGMTWSMRRILLVGEAQLHMWDAEESFLLSYDRC